jgi:hypothetical protein
MNIFLETAPSLSHGDWAGLARPGEEPFVVGGSLKTSEYPSELPGQLQCVQ